MTRLVRPVVFTLLVLLGVMPGTRPHEMVAVTGAASHTHTLDTPSGHESTAAQPSGTIVPLANLAVAPPQAFQHRHGRLTPRWDAGHPASGASNPWSIDAFDSYVGTIRTAATGSVSFRATSIPPPAL